MREHAIILGHHHLHGTPARLYAVDRQRHVYVVGKTGTGKSTLQFNLVMQDLLAGEGVCVIDPHGSLAEDVLRHFPSWRARDLVYLNPADPSHSVGLNLLDVPEAARPLAAAHVVSIFHARWKDSWGPSLEQLLGKCVAALMDTPGSTFLGIQRMLRDKDYRERVVARVRDQTVRDYWTKEFAGYSAGQRSDKIAPVLNKVDPFLSDPATRHIFGQSRSTFDLRFVMDQKRVLIVNLASGAIGEASTNLIGAFLVSKIFLTAMSRVTVLEAHLDALEEEIDHRARHPNFYLYIDEFQNFSSSIFSRILSEARKFNLAMSLSHQYIEQTPEEIQAAVFGNVGSMAVFRVGRSDAERLAPELDDEDNVLPGHLTGLGSYRAYVKLLSAGEEGQAFQLTTLPPYESGCKGRQKRLIESSRMRFATARREVEAKIARWFAHPAAPRGVYPQARTRAPTRTDEIMARLSAVEAALAEKAAAERERATKLQERISRRFDEALGNDAGRVNPLAL